MGRIVPAFVGLILGFATLVAATSDPSPPIPLKAPPAAKDASKPDAKTDPAEAHALAAVLRELLEKHLPDPLSQSKQNWGKQKTVTVVHHHRDGLRFWSEPVEEMQNDGVWRKISVRIPDPEKIVLAVTELTHPEPGKALATVGVTAERVDMDFAQQVWRTGLRLYSGETRGHCKGSLLVKVEVTTKTEFKAGSFFPDVSLKMRATEAQLGYEGLVIDHTAGVGGEAAKLLGEAAIKMVKTFKPDLEHELLEKGNAAIVKAAGMREVKASLDKVMVTGKK
jgi:hypothetical protein